MYFCEVGTEYLNIIYINSMPKKTKHASQMPYHLSLTVHYNDDPYRTEYICKTGVLVHYHNIRMSRMIFVNLVKSVGYTP